MEIGKLRRRITIQTFTDVDNGSGGSTRTWSDFATVWADINPANGREVYQAQQIRADITHKITIRYLKGLRAAMRVIYGERTFNIRSVIDVEERHRAINLMCEEVQAN